MTDERIKPYAEEYDPKRSTHFPNGLIDNVMPVCPDAAFVVLMYSVRHCGLDSDRVTFTYRELKQRTPITSYQEASGAVRWLERHGLLTRISAPGSFPAEYRLDLTEIYSEKWAGMKRVER